MTTAESQGGGGVFLQGDGLISGFYLNELLMRLLARHDPHSHLFLCYQRALQALILNHDVDWALRLFERDLLQELGYGLLLTEEGEGGGVVDAGARYCYHHESGPRRVLCAQGERFSVQGATLLALAAGECEDRQLRHESKLLMREVLGRYLGSRPLASRELFRQKRSRGDEE